MGWKGKQVLDGESKTVDAKSGGELLSHTTAVTLKPLINLIDLRINVGLVIGLLHRPWDTQLALIPLADEVRHPLMWPNPKNPSGTSYSLGPGLRAKENYTLSNTRKGSSSLLLTVTLRRKQCHSTVDIVPGSQHPVSYTHLDVYKRQD